MTIPQVGVIPSEYMCKAMFCIKLKSWSSFKASCKHTDSEKKPSWKERTVNESAVTHIYQIINYLVLFPWWHRGTPPKDRFITVVIIPFCSFSLFSLQLYFPFPPSLSLAQTSKLTFFLSFISPKIKASFYYSPFFKISFNIWYIHLSNTLLLLLWPTWLSTPFIILKQRTKTKSIF